MKNKKDMIKWLNNLKSDMGQPQHSQLWHYVEILDVIAKYLESTERTGEWIYITNPIGKKICVCSECEHIKQQGYGEYCGYCGAKMDGDSE